MSDAELAFKRENVHENRSIGNFFSFVKSANFFFPTLLFDLDLICE